MKRTLTALAIALTATTASADYERVNSHQYAGMNIATYADFDQMRVDGGMLLIPAFIVMGDVQFDLDLSFSCHTGRPAGLDMIAAYDLEAEEEIEMPRDFIEGFTDAILAAPASADDIAGTKIACKILN